MLTDYLDEVVTTRAHDAYKGVPLATHSMSARGHILERVAMRVMERTVGETACDPPPGVCINGAKRGRNSATYDFMIQGRRIEVKSSMLTWDTDGRRWVAQWVNVKRDSYDDLLLVLYTPFGLYMFLHDHTYGVSTSGMIQTACGGKVSVRAPCNEMSISAALDVILGKMSHMHYTTLPLTEVGDIVTTTMSHDAYADVPLATHCQKARGDILECVAMRVMEKKMGATAHPPAPGTCVNGTKRRRNGETCDFMIRGRCIEIKSSMLTWNTHTRRWRVSWINVKRDSYDDLLLILYTPFGLYMFLHDHTYGVSTNGVSQAAKGGRVSVHAPQNESSICAATDVILKKMKHMHYASLAYS